MEKSGSIKTSGNRNEHGAKDASGKILFEIQISGIIKRRVRVEI